MKVCPQCKKEFNSVYTYCSVGCSNKSRKGKHMSPATEFKKGSKVNLGRKMPKYVKEKLLKANIGRTPWIKGKKQPQETKDKIRNTLLGRKLPKEHKRHIQISMKKYFGTELDVKYVKGYNLIFKPEHPYANHQGYVYEHRITMEKSIKRYLKPEEIVHHIDQDRWNNDIENLMLFPSNTEHVKYHWKVMKKRGVSSQV